jgi:hypothetical protein
VLGLLERKKKIAFVVCVVLRLASFLFLSRRFCARGAPSDMALRSQRLKQKSYTTLAFQWLNIYD